MNTAQMNMLLDLIFVVRLAAILSVVVVGVSVAASVWWDDGHVRRMVSEDIVPTMTVLLFVAGVVWYALLVVGMALELPPGPKAKHA